MELLREWRVTGRTADSMDPAALKGVERVSRQLSRLLAPSAKKCSDRCDSDSVGRLLLVAWPDRVAQARMTEAGRYLLSNGRGARLAVAGSVRPAPFLVAVSVDGGDQGDGVIHLSASVTETVVRRELGERIEQREGMVWDVREGRVAAVREEYLGALRLSSALFVPSPDMVAPVVVEAVRSSSLGLLTLDGALRQLQGRVRLVREAFPNEGWPDLSDAALLDTLDEWLMPNIHGIRTAQGVAGVNVAALVAGRLEYRQRQLLDELAPTHMNVPSGSRIRLDYADGELPVLAVKLQELFGLAETPTVARGRVALLLHLLSPAGRPLQVTKDLKGFWDGSYHQVKKEMKGRYPRHPWPDDPWSALPTRRVKPKAA